MRSSRNVLLGVVLSVVCVGDANATLGVPLTFSFDGYIDFVHDFLDLDGTVIVGAPFSGTYTFDPTGVADYYPNDPGIGSYGFPDGQMSARIGNYDFFTHDLGILIGNDTLSGDLYEPISTTPFEAAGTQWSGMRLVLLDESGTALNSDALPTGVPELLDYPSFAGLNLHLPGNDVGIRGRLTSLTPEPSSVVLLALGGVLLCRRRRG